DTLSDESVHEPVDLTHGHPGDVHVRIVILLPTHAISTRVDHSVDSSLLTMTLWGAWSITWSWWDMSRIESTTPREIIDVKMAWTMGSVSLSNCPRGSSSNRVRTIPGLLSLNTFTMANRLESVRRTRSPPENVSIGRSQPSAVLTEMISSCLVPSLDLSCLSCRNSTCIAVSPCMDLRISFCSTSICRRISPRSISGIPLGPHASRALSMYSISG